MPVGNRLEKIKDKFMKDPNLEEIIERAIANEQEAIDFYIINFHK